jgi:hypothetical protein
MTDDEIIEMAIQSRLAFDSEEYPEIWQTYMNVGKQEIEAFANLVAAKEREACAKLCDERFEKHPDLSIASGEAVMCAHYIRARGEQA